LTWVKKADLPKKSIIRRGGLWAFRKLSKNPRTMGRENENKKTKKRIGKNSTGVGKRGGLEPG